jgi:sec-independent protein translocase protein TatA
MSDLFAPWHVIILVGAFVLLFGARRLPEAARSAGEALRIFRAEVRDRPPAEAPTAATPPAVATPTGPEPAANQTAPR